MLIHCGIRQKRILKAFVLAYIYVYIHMYTMYHNLISEKLKLKEKISENGICMMNNLKQEINTICNLQIHIHL